MASVDPQFLLWVELAAGDEPPALFGIEIDPGGPPSLIGLHLDQLAPVEPGVVLQVVQPAQGGGIHLEQLPDDGRNLVPGVDPGYISTYRA